MAIVVEKIKGKKYVYEQYKMNDRVVTRYIGPPEEIAKVYKLYKRGELAMKRYSRDCWDNLLSLLPSPHTILAHEA